MKKIIKHHSFARKKPSFFSLAKLSLLFVFFVIVSCKKDFLDKKPDKSLLVPTTLSDFQALLDNNSVMNLGPFLPILSADEYEMNATYYKTADLILKNSYTWAQDIYSGGSGVDWNASYKQVFYANVVLDGLANFKPDSTNQQQFNYLKGAAFFYRAFAFYQLVEEFSAPYNAQTAGQLPGIPIRLSSDVNIVSTRGTLLQSYNQVISDLEAAALLLPNQVGYKTQPHKAAVWAILARVYLTMQDYAHALSFSDKALQPSSTLIDYNTLVANPSGTTNPFPKVLPNGNPEVVYYSSASFLSFLAISTAAVIDTDLYRSYDPNDLRRSLYFVNRGGGVINFKGSYSGVGLVATFDGIANDELFLIRSECYARTGNIINAMADLNNLLKKRWKTGAFVPLSAADENSALMLIIAERKKELVFRGLRWSDLRRLNTEDQFKVTLQRNIGGQQYVLKPGDNRYVLPIPDNEINVDGLTQNPR